jgi:hypothetical protein
MDSPEQALSKVLEAAQALIRLDGAEPSFEPQTVGNPKDVTACQPRDRRHSRLRGAEWHPEGSHLETFYRSWERSILFFVGADGGLFRLIGA